MVLAVAASTTVGADQLVHPQGIGILDGGREQVQPPQAFGAGSVGDVVEGDDETPLRSPAARHAQLADLGVERGPNGGTLRTVAHQFDDDLAPQPVGTHDAAHFEKCPVRAGQIPGRAPWSSVVDEVDVGIHSVARSGHPHDGP